jgi:hypothetical protein
VSLSRYCVRAIREVKNSVTVQSHFPFGPLAECSNAHCSNETYYYYDQLKRHPLCPRCLAEERGVERVAELICNAKLIRKAES